MASDASASPNHRAPGEAPHVVILGAGFAGLYAARALKKADVRLTVVDKRNHHLFQPLLYQVASAALSPADIAYPIRRALRKQRNAEVLLAAVERVDTERRRVILDDGAEVDYDYLIVAVGSTHSYFGNDEWAEHAPGLKNVEEALEIRRRILLAYEAAEREPDPEARKRLLTFAVVGAGPTGVELAGALREIAVESLAGDFRHCQPEHTRVLLLEGGDRVLPAYPEELSAKAQRQLERLGVEVRTGAMVSGIDEDGVVIGEDERIEAHNVFWAAGVAASPLAKSLDAELDKGGRVRVNEYLNLPGRAEVFVVGDLAACTDADGKEVPGLAPAAIQGGKHAAHCIRDDLARRKRQPFRYKDRGSLATIGRARAVADLGRLRFSGLPAWLAWLLVHIAFLIGFRSRVFVLMAWAWQYLSFQRGARLITGAPGGQAPTSADAADAGASEDEA